LFILTGAHSYSAWWLSICSILRKPLLIQWWASYELLPELWSQRHN
jgi:hypothetical protein